MQIVSKPLQYTKFATELQRPIILAVTRLQRRCEPRRGEHKTNVANKRRIVISVEFAGVVALHAERARREGRLSSTAVLRRNTRVEKLTIKGL